MSEPDRAAILAEILDATLPELRQPGDFTVADYRVAAEARGQPIAERTAFRYLEALAKEGRLLTLKVHDPGAGRQVRIWRKVGGAA